MALNTKQPIQCICNDMSESNSDLHRELDWIGQTFEISVNIIKLSLNEAVTRKVNIDM